MSVSASRCEYKLPALRDTFVRQTSSGNILLLLFAFWILIPAAIERYRGEPNIHASLALLQLGQDYVIHDKVTVKHPNYGTRFNAMMDAENRILCAKTWPNYWNSNTLNKWTLPAFVDCEAPNDIAFKVCSYFSLTSKTGTSKKVGSGEEFCTDLTYPIFKF